MFHGGRDDVLAGVAVLVQGKADGPVVALRPAGGEDELFTLAAERGGDDMAARAVVVAAAGEQRQRANYSADADAEWAEYQAALIQAANYTLRPKLLGNFNNASYIAAYQTISTRLTAAAEALDAKLVAASVDSLKTAVEAVQGAPNPEGSVYWDQGYNFFGYDDFNSVQRVPACYL